VTTLHPTGGTGRGLTERQAAILGAIRQFMSQRGFPPSVREIGIAVGLTSPSTVAHHLKVLAELGHITRDPNVARGLRIADPPDSGNPPETQPRASAGSGLVQGETGGQAARGMESGRGVETASATSPPVELATTGGAR